jgi:hypothetical protein
MAMDDAPPVAWHVQDITLANTSLAAEYGLARGVGLALASFYRQVHARVRFQDEARAPVVLPSGDIHHRNETLRGPGDPWAMVVVGGGVGAWSIAGRAGVSVPLGRTEPNPFELGRRGLPHQHIQFGTGTWDPIVGLALGRRFTWATLVASAQARLVAYANGHGYRAGDRYDGSAFIERRLGARWRVQGGFDVGHEAAERWSGIVEEEGNLGRTDVLASAAMVRQVGRAGALVLSLKVPVYTHAVRAQVDYPLIVGFGWSR